MYIEIKTAQNRFETIVLQVKKMVFLDLVFGLLENDEINHLIVFINGFDSYQEFEQAVLDSSFKSDERLDFLHNSKIPDLDFLQTRFDLWFHHFYTSCLQHQIVKYTEIGEKLDIDSFSTNDNLKSELIGDFININYNNVLNKPKRPPFPKDSLLEFVHNPTDKSHNHKTNEQQRLEHLSQTISTPAKRIHFSTGSHLVNVNSEHLKRLYEQLKSKKYDVHYYKPESFAELISFQESIKWRTSYVATKPKLTSFVLNNLRLNVSIPTTLCDMKMHLKHTFINSIFLIDLKHLTETSKSGFLEQHFGNTLIEDSKLCHIATMINTTPDIVEQSKKSPNLIISKILSDLSSKCNKAYL